MAKVYSERRKSSTDESIQLNVSYSSSEINEAFHLTRPVRPESLQFLTIIPPSCGHLSQETNTPWQVGCQDSRRAYLDMQALACAQRMVTQMRINRKCQAKGYDVTTSQGTLGATSSWWERGTHFSPGASRETVTPLTP